MITSYGIIHWVRSQNFHFLPPDAHAYVCVSGGRKCQFFGKFRDRTQWMIPTVMWFAEYSNQCCFGRIMNTGWGEIINFFFAFPQKMITFFILDIPSQFLSFVHREGRIPFPFSKSTFGIALNHEVNMGKISSQLIVYLKLSNLNSLET